jgi:hypothetical protein
MNTNSRQIAPERDNYHGPGKIWLTALILSFVSLGCLFARGQSATTAKSSPKPAKQAQPPAATADARDPGERKFQANCSRCHNAPEELSPRITGTVVRHMRVRALLSAQDERDILRYLAP